jgi:hypothetical protein
LKKLKIKTSALRLSTAIIAYESLINESPIARLARLAPAVPACSFFENQPEAVAPERDN